MQTDSNTLSLTELIVEARRQTAVCNSCRYCEGYCSVFPALHRQREMSDGDITQLANLCHNCRGCYYACQYAEPHEFAINVPKALAEVRSQSWQQFAFPDFMGTLFQRSGLAIAALVVAGIVFILLLAQILTPDSSQAGFYAVISHSVMVALFIPAFLFPLFSVAISLRRYWQHTGGGSISIHDIRHAFGSAARMKNLDGGHGDGCNFEDEDRFTQGRRKIHHAVMYGFLLCFASTASATVLHYVFNQPAPYGLLSLPKLFGISGGLLLAFGTFGMMAIKKKADPELSDKRMRGGEFAFILLLFLVSVSGLLLYVLGGTGLVGGLLYIHLGVVLAFFLLMPYSKMVHGFYRMAALVKEEQQKRLTS